MDMDSSVCLDSLIPVLPCKPTGEQIQWLLTKQEGDNDRNIGCEEKSIVVSCTDHLNS